MGISGASSTTAWDEPRSRAAATSDTASSVVWRSRPARRVAEAAAQADKLAARLRTDLLLPAAVRSAWLAPLLVACGGQLGSVCTYAETSGTVEVTALAPSGAGCTNASYRWTEGGPSRFPAFDELRFSNNPCLESGKIRLGATFAVRRRDLVSGTCTPSLHAVLDPSLEACLCP